MSFQNNKDLCARAALLLMKEARELLPPHFRINNRNTARRKSIRIETVDGEHLVWRAVRDEDGHYFGGLEPDFSFLNLVLDEFFARLEAISSQKIAAQFFENKRLTKERLVDRQRVISKIRSSSSYEVL